MVVKARTLFVTFVVVTAAVPAALFLQTSVLGAAGRFHLAARPDAGSAELVQQLEVLELKAASLNHALQAWKSAGLMHPPPPPPAAPVGPPTDAASPTDLATTAHRAWPASPTPPLMPLPAPPALQPQLSVTLAQPSLPPPPPLQSGGGRLPAPTPVPEDSRGKSLAAAAGLERRSAHLATPLMVGGSDGSGTRSVVALLQKLGVHMIIDDSGTNDVHAAEMGGWPPVVKPVLEATHSADYDFDSLEPRLRANTMRELSKFTSSMHRQGQRKASKTRGVSFGFKAPVSMLLVPFMEHSYSQSAPGFKFLHVVRDGRDIAFSGNQSPVTKFYTAMYGSAKFSQWNHMPEVRAIQLWSDLNADVHAWSARRLQADSDKYGYLEVHTEDLIDPATKFEAVRQIAGFVGAEHLTNDQLCCMVVAPEKFMGSHSVKGRGESGDKAASQLKSRYGHWQSKVGNRPDLHAAIHREGARGLRVFGYEPRRDRVPTSPDGYKCTMTHQQCVARGLAKVGPARAAATDCC